MIDYLHYIQIFNKYLKISFITRYIYFYKIIKKFYFNNLLIDKFVIINRIF